MKDPILIVGKLEDGGGSGKYALVTEAGYKITLAVDNNNLTATLFNKNNDELSKVTVTLPVAQSITSGYYDENTNEIVFVLADGNEIRLPAEKILKGLATEKYVQDYVEEYGGKINTIQVNGVEVPIVDKIVNIEGLASEEFVNEKIEEVKELIPTVPTKVSAFDNDAGYLTEHQSLSDYAKASYVDSEITRVEAEIPEVPTVVSAFENDAGYLTEHQSLSDYAKKEYVDTNVEALDNSLSTVAKSGSYNDLTDTPEIPVVPTDVSAFNNDAGYLTEHQSLDNYYDKNQVDSKLADKQDILTAGTNITIDQNNVISADIDLSSYAKLTDLQIGRTFTTNITVGHLESGTVINATDTLGEILYNILYKNQPTEYSVYVGKASEIPSSITGLQKVDFNSSDVGVQKTYTTPQVSNEYIVIACSNQLKLQSWIAINTGWALSFAKVETPDYNIFYINEPQPAIFDDGKITQQAKDYKFTFVEV